jgi:long-subunit fatty acid transport protein
MPVRRAEENRTIEESMEKRAMFKRVLVAGILCVLCGVQNAGAQFVEDAQRLATPGLGGGARALGTGDAFIGVADDFSALLWNPAGLAQSSHGEFSFGLSYLTNKDNSTYLGSSSSYSSNGTYLNTLGFVLPIQVRRGSASVAFGYSRQAVYKSGVAFDGFNTVSSIIQTYAPNNGAAGQGYVDNLAYQLYLADYDTTKATWISPINGNVQQRGSTTETGGLNNWMFGGAIDVAPNLSAGVTATYVSGSYRYDRNYNELDSRNIYAYPYDLAQLTLDDFIEDDISGYNFLFGLMYRDPEKFRVGFSIKTPTWFTINEDFGTTGSSTFRTTDAQGNSTYGPTSVPGSNQYNVETPWVFGLGASYTLRGLTLSGDAQYTDWTQTKFSNAPSDVMAKNTSFGKLFRGTWNLRGGASYLIQPIGVTIRGGFIYNPSIYKSDPTSFDQKYVTGGLGIRVDEGTSLDFALAHGWWMAYRVNYDNTTQINEKVTANTFLLTLTHRF